MTRDRRTTDREQARATLLTKVESCRVHEADQLLPAYARKHFCTYDPKAMREDAEFRLRWLDCAPEGARFVTAPLMDKQGTPLGMNNDENIGPGKAMREAYARRGFDWQNALTHRAAVKAGIASPLPAKVVAA